MKKLIPAFLIAVTAYTAQAQRQPNIYDTLAHLQAIYNKKEAFIGKPFSVLLDSLKYNIVYFGTVGGIPSDKSKETSTGFYFINPESLDEFQSMCIDVYWQPYLDHNYTAQLYSASSGLWSVPAEQYYKNGIVDDIDVSDDIKNFGKDLYPVLQTNTAIETDPAITGQLNAVKAHNNNHKYDNQLFSLLWNDLNVKPKTVLGYTDYVQSEKEGYTRFFFSTPDQLSVTNFTVYWKDPIPKTATQQYQQGVLRDFIDANEYAIYANKIVKEVAVSVGQGDRWVVASCVYKKVLIDGLYQWRYQITKKYCQNGQLGSQSDVSYSTTSVPVENCTTVLEQ